MNKPDARLLNPTTQDYLRQQAIRLRQQGKRFVDIAAYLGVHRNTVSNWWQQYQALGETALHQQQRGRSMGTGRSLNQAQESEILQLMQAHFPNELTQCATLFSDVPPQKKSHPKLDATPIAILRMGSMFSIDEFIIAVFCCVDDLLQAVTQGQPIRHGGFAPALSDAEVLTMEIVGEYRGIATDQGIWQYFRQHWFAWFPSLSSRTSFARQAANLGQYKSLIQQRLAARLGAFTSPVHLIDGFPIPVCEFRRAHFCRSFQGEAGYGHCASKAKTYYGFHGYLNITADGVITGFCLTPAAGDEREALWETVTQIHGVLIGNKGYIQAQLKTELLSECIDLQTQLRDNMKESRPVWWLKLIKRVRRWVETVIGQLAGRFQIERVWARDLWHLTSRLNRKLLAHTVCRWLNRHQPHPLRFANLVS